MGGKSIPLADRFWAKVKVLGPDDCWLWQGYKQVYGRVGDGEGGHLLAHVAAWELHNMAKVPEGMVVRHTCDTPPCCNPAHLLLGTYAQNTADMFARGRNGATGKSGEENPSSKLSDQDVQEIRKLSTTYEVPMAEIARQYSISAAQVSRIVNGKSRKPMYALETLLENQQK